MEPDLPDLFLRTAKRMRRRQMAYLAPLGLTPAQSRALRMVAEAERPPRMVDIAERLGIVPRSVTSVIDDLEAAGLVVREPDPANRRSTLVLPTEQGRRVRAEMNEARRRAAIEEFAPLSDEQQRTLRELLAALDPVVSRESPSG